MPASAASAAATDLDVISFSIFSACERSKRPLRKARRVNSPENINAKKREANNADVNLSSNPLFHPKPCAIKIGSKIKTHYHHFQWEKTFKLLV